MPHPAVLCSCRLSWKTVVTSTGQRSLWRHPPRTRPGQAGMDYRTGAALRIAAAVLPSSLPSLQAQEDPPLQSHLYSSRLAENPHFHMLSHSEGAKRGSPAYKNHTASQQLHSTRSPQTFERSTEESKHHCTPHTRQSLPLPKAIRKAASHSQGPCRQTVRPKPGHPARSAWPPHLPAISIGFSLFRLSLLPASEICAPKAAFRSRSVSLPVLRDLKRGHTT